jgi:hypothetical protein
MYVNKGLGSTFADFSISCLITKAGAIAIILVDKLRASTDFAAIFAEVVVM